MYLDKEIEGEVKVCPCRIISERVGRSQSDFIVLKRMETVGAGQKSLFIFENNKIKIVDSINHLINFINSSHYF